MANVRSVRDCTATFRPAGFFALRAPALPFDTLASWADGPSGSAEMRGAPTGCEVAELRERLRAIVRRPEVREALFVASPTLDTQLDVWLATPAPEAEEMLRIERPLVRYVERMAWRATPFGLFAGTGLGEIGSATRIEIAGAARHRRTTRLDTEFLGSLVAGLAAHPTVRRRLVYRGNTSLHLRPDEAAFVEARAVPGRERRTRTIPRTPYLDEVLRRAADGATIDQIGAALGALAPEAPPEAVERFVNGLIEAQVLVDDLELPVVGRDPLEHLLENLAGAGEWEPVHRALRSVQGRLHAIDGAPGPNGNGEYLEVAEALESVAQCVVDAGGGDAARRPRVQVERSRLFHVEFTHALESAMLGEPVAREMLAGAGVLRALAPVELGPLDAFRLAFRARYGERDVPLLDVLDEVTGIGFDAALASTTVPPPLLRGVEFPPPASPGTAPWGAREIWLAQRAWEAARSGGGGGEITISDADLVSIGRDPDLPDSFAVLATLHTEDPRGPDRGDYRVHVRRVVGPTGTSLLGRFCGADPALTDRVRALADAEARLAGDALVAEIVHLPHERTGNVACRPALRAFEIPILGRSTAGGDGVLPLSDLTVAIVEDEVILRSKSRDRRVLPRLSCSDNFRLPGVAAYRFLAMVAASEAAAPPCWSWGPLDCLPALPRVVYGRCILALARWRLGPEMTTELARLGRPARRARIEAVRAEMRLRRRVLFVQHDQTLPVDLDNEISVDAFVQVAAGKVAVLEEMFPGPGSPCCIPGAEGRFAHELVVPFVRREPRRRRDPRPDESRWSASGAGLTSERVRFPGEDWLYAKLYCESGAADRVLRDVLAPVAGAAVSTGAADRWFFVRYGDPDWHLRVRFHGTPERLLAEVQRELTRRAGDARRAGLIHRLELASYDPEWERYGVPESMPLVEQIFHLDSIAALRIATAYPCDPDARWRLALLGMHTLLAALAPDANARCAIVAAAREQFARECGLVGRWARPLGERFRRERTALRALLCRPLEHDHPLRPGQLIVEQRDAALRAVVIDLLGRFGMAPGGVRGVLHMHANRVLASDQRLQETFLYDFLERIERARAASASSERVA